jgi:hypothetical protein
MFMEEAIQPHHPGLVEMQEEEEEEQEWDEGESEEEGSEEQEPKDPAVPRFRSEEDLIRVLGKDDPDRMLLTETEHNLALKIKTRVEHTPEVDHHSDYIYALLAITCRGRSEEDLIEDAVQRCLGLQEFRIEYKIADTYDEGSRLYQEVFNLFPEVYLSFSFSEREGTYIYVKDNSKFDPKVFTSAELADNWLRAMYYFFAVFFPDLESARRGVICFIECKGMGLRSDVLNHHTALYSQLVSAYPVNGQVRHFNTGAMMNVFVSILRKLLPKHLKDRFQVGFQFDQMSETFLSPTVEIANQRMIARMRETLKRRLHNEKTFSL